MLGQVENKRTDLSNPISLTHGRELLASGSLFQD